MQVDPSVPTSVFQFCVPQLYAILASVAQFLVSVYMEDPCMTSEHTCLPSSHADIWASQFTLSFFRHRALHGRDSSHADMWAVQFTLAVLETPRSRERGKLHSVARRCTKSPGASVGVSEILVPDRL